MTSLSPHLNKIEPNALDLNVLELSIFIYSVILLENYVSVSLDNTS